MLIIKPYIFKQFPEIICGVSTKIGNFVENPFYFNLSLSVGDDSAVVLQNRKYFFSEIGLDYQKAAYQKQIHSDEIVMTNRAGIFENSDALITNQQNLSLVVTIADCLPIMIYDPNEKVIAAVHSGWRGTSKRILDKVIKTLRDKFNSKSGNLFVYLGPSITQANYEVGTEVKELFDQKYLLRTGSKYFLNIVQANLDMLYQNGVKKNQIQISGLCTYEMKNVLHSYRRDGEKSGRALAVISMKDENVG